MDCIIPSQKRKSLRGSLDSIPGDKSISHRAVMIGALSESVCRFTHFLMSEDCLHTIEIFREMGVKIDVSNDMVTVTGVGLRGLRASSKVLDAGNSGTSIRLMSGILAGQNFESRITGDASVQRRPMKRVADPLRKMGARIDGDFPPLTIYGGALSPIKYALPVASAQVKSAILFASLYCKEPTTVTEPAECRDHTERMLRLFGADIHVRNRTVTCSGKNRLELDRAVQIPSDVSSSAFFIILALLMPGSDVFIKHIGLNPTRDALIPLLRQMGADIEIQNGVDDWERVGDLRVKASSLSNLTVPESIIPIIIDEIPILAISGLFGKGKLKVTGAKELRVKESDRIKTIVELVKKMGGSIEEFEDGFELEGPREFRDFEIDSYGDHRIAMSAIIGAIASGRQAKIVDVGCIATSFPNFFEILTQFGLSWST